MSGNWKNPFLLQKQQLQQGVGGAGTTKGDDMIADGSSISLQHSMTEDSSTGDDQLQNSVLVAECAPIAGELGKKGKSSYTKDMRVSCEAIPEEIAGMGTTPPTTDALLASKSAAQAALKQQSRQLQPQPYPPHHHPPPQHSHSQPQPPTSPHPPTLLSSLSCPAPAAGHSDNNGNRTTGMHAQYPAGQRPTMVLTGLSSGPVPPLAVATAGSVVSLRASASTSKSESLESVSSSTDPGLAVVVSVSMGVVAGKPPQSPTQTSPRLPRHRDSAVGGSGLKPESGHEIQKSVSLVLDKSATHKMAKDRRSGSIEKLHQQQHQQQYFQQMQNTHLDAQQRNRSATISGVTPSAANRKPLVLRQPAVTRKDNPRSGISPSFVFLQLYHAAQFGNVSEIPLQVDATNLIQIQRALKVLDSIPPYETHKIGVIYVGPDQNGNEAEILRNRYGSVRYVDFLRRLGTLIKLQDVDPQVFFLGGLEQNGADGNYAYIWQDDVIRVMFHVATLMPNKDSDPLCTNKKLHIGNNNVTIVYNESGEEYNLNTLKGQFNFAAIEVQPLDHATNKVTIKAKDDLVQLIGQYETKLVSDQNVAILARQLALHTNLASMVSNSISLKGEDPYASNWLERLRKIKNLRNKVEQVKSENLHDKRGRKGQMDDFTEYT